MNTFTNALAEAKRNAEDWRAKEQQAHSEFVRWSNIADGLEEVERLHIAPVSEFLKAGRTSTNPGVKTRRKSGVDWQQEIRDIVWNAGTIQRRELYATLKQRHGREGYDVISRLIKDGTLVDQGGNISLAEKERNRELASREVTA